MVFWRLAVLLITLISISLEQFNARPLHPFEHLYNQVSPSPSSVAAANANLGTNQVPAGQPTAAFHSGTCAGASNKCQDDLISMTACFFPAEKGYEESLLLVLNNGETLLMLKVNVSPANKTYAYIQIPRHDFKKGGIGICYKLRIQELEMGQPEPHSSAEGWNESWDDDWEDEKGVKSPGGKTIRQKQATDFDDLDKS